MERKLGSFEKMRRGDIIRYPGIVPETVVGFDIGLEDFMVGSLPSYPYSSVFRPVSTIDRLTDMLSAVTDELEEYITSEYGVGPEHNPGKENEKVIAARKLLLEVKHAA